MVVLVIPAHLRTPRDAAWLEHCVASALTREGLDQVLVVDDGSPAAWPRLAPGVEVLRIAPNGGPAGARNLGIERALSLGARHVLFTDVDCVPDPGWARALTAYLDGREDVVAAGGVTRSLGATLLDRYHDFAGTLNGRWLLPACDELVYAPTCNLAVRGSALARVRFDERFPIAAGEDFDFSLKLRREGRIGLATAAVVRHDFGYDSTIGGLPRFVATFRRYSAADPLVAQNHPDMKTFRTESCAAADVLARVPPLDPRAYRRGSTRRVRPRRYQLAMALLKRVARWAYKSGKRQPLAWRTLERR